MSLNTFALKEYNNFATLLVQVDIQYCICFYELLLHVVKYYTALILK